MFLVIFFKQIEVSIWGLAEEMEEMKDDLTLSNLLYFTSSRKNKKQII